MLEERADKERWRKVLEEDMRRRQMEREEEIRRHRQVVSFVRSWRDVKMFRLWKLSEDSGPLSAMHLVALCAGG